MALRISFVCGRSLPRSRGAAEVVARRHARLLAELGHDVRIVDGESVPKQGVDVVHVVDVAALDRSVVERAACCAPVVLSLHGPLADTDDVRAQVAAAERVLVPSRTHLVRLSQFLDFRARQVKLLGPGLCLDLPARRRRPRPWDGAGPLRVLHAGRRYAEKGTLDLVQALAAQPPGSVELLAPGGGERGFDDELRAAAGDLPLELGGSYDGAQLARVAARCHVAALPSRVPESYSLRVDEAVALGLPVWTSGGEAARERFDASVVTVLPSRSPGSWAEAFTAWLDHPELAREACAALPVAVPTVAAAVSALERTYLELLSVPVEPTLPSASRHRRPA